jgi:hypothetical protein
MTSKGLTTMFFRRTIDFRWVQQDNKWILQQCKRTWFATEIMVEPIDDMFFAIVVSGSPLMGRYTSAQGAKLDAWQFLTSITRSFSAATGNPAS